jgi:hypothetical protein
VTKALIAYAVIFLAMLGGSLGTFFATRRLNILVRLSLALLSAIVMLFAIILILRVALR